jgi:hypothetical protein
MICSCYSSHDIDNEKHEGEYRLEQGNCYLVKDCWPLILIYKTFTLPGFASLFLGTHSSCPSCYYCSCLSVTWNCHCIEKPLSFLFFCTCVYIGIEENVGPTSCKNSISDWSTSTCCATGQSIHMCCFACVVFGCSRSTVTKFQLLSCSLEYVGDEYTHCS